MGRIKPPRGGCTRIKCDCSESGPCGADDFVSYSMPGFAQKQAKEQGWRRRKHGDVFWFAHGHAGAWERLTVSCDCGVSGCSQAMSWPTSQGVKWRLQLKKAGWTKVKKKWFAKGHAPPAKAEEAAA